MSSLSLSVINPNAARDAARALPSFDTLEWRADFARGIRAALGAEGRPAYLVDAIARIGRALGQSELYEVSAPGASGNAKLAKSDGVVTLSFTGASGADSGRYNPCPSIGACGGFCVLGATCGQASLTPEHVIGARARRLIAMREHPVAAGALLVRATARARRLADSLGLARVVARMNVGTDIGFEAIEDIDSLFGRFGAEPYAYTKRPGAVRAAMRAGGFVGHTRVVASWHEGMSERLAADYLRSGGTVALVVAGLGRSEARSRRVDRIASVRIDGTSFPAINGDRTDDRTTDPAGVVVVLGGKGPLADAEGVDSADPLGFAIRSTDARIAWRAAT